MVYEFLICKLTNENSLLITIMEIAFYTNLTFQLRPLDYPQPKATRTLQDTIPG